MSKIKKLYLPLLASVAMNIGNVYAAADDAYTRTVSSSSSGSSSSSTSDGEEIVTRIIEGEDIRQIIGIPYDKNRVVSVFDATFEELNVQIPTNLSSIMAEYGALPYYVVKDGRLSLIYDLTTVSSGGTPFVDNIYSATLSGTNLYVLRENKSVLVIDTTTNIPIADIPVGDDIHSATLSGTNLYVLQQKSISVIDTTTNTKIADIPVGKRPKSATIIAGNLLVICRDGLYSVDLDRLFSTATTTVASSASSASSTFTKNNNNNNNH